MAITKDDIFKAADEIKASGNPPTLAAIRKRVGGGSFTTISEAIKEWRGLSAPLAPIQDPAPDAITHSLAELGAEIWAAAIAMANDRLIKERSSMEASRAEFEAARKEAAELADQLSADLDTERESSLAAMAMASADVVMLQNRIDAAKKGEAEAQSQANAVSSKIDEMAARLDDAKAANAREVDARAVEQSKHDATRQRLSDVESKLATAIAELATAQGQARGDAAEVAAMRPLLAQAESQSAVAQAVAEQLQAQASERAGDVGRLHKQIADLTEALKSATAESASRAKMDAGKTEKGNQAQAERGAGPSTPKSGDDDR